MSCIYRIDIADWTYIGQTVNFNKRKYMHLYHLRKGTHGNPFLQNLFDKYGEETLIFTVLEDCVPELLSVREAFWMENVQCPKGRLINICTSSPSVFGQKRSKETCLKISKSKLGKPRSTETKQKLRIANLGKTLGNRGLHPCPFCGNQRAERYRSTGEFLGYHKTCRTQECKNRRKVV